MEQQKPMSPNRIVFLDNLRSLMVLLVLVFHSGAGYGTIVAFWPYHDSNPAEFVDILMLLMDVFMMSILFFIAGYFAFSSLTKRGSGSFLAGKFKQLGIPWLLITILVLPVLDYVNYYARSAGGEGSIRSYGAHWLLSMQKILEFRFGRLNMSQYLDMTEQFYQRYVWFLSLLLLFFVVFGLLYLARGRWSRGRELSTRDDTRSNRSVFPALAVVGFLNVALFALVKFLLSSPENPFDMVWFSMGNLFQFEIAKLAFYIPYFGLGVYACSRGWFTGGKDFGRPWVWILICFALMTVNMLVGRSMVRASEPSVGLQLAFVVLYPLWTLSFLGAFAAFASRHWNRPAPLGGELAANSYTMYLTHYIFPMTLPLLLGTWAAGPALIKFGCVAVLTVLLSYALSKYVVRRFPRGVVIGLAGLNILLAVIT